MKYAADGQTYVYHVDFHVNGELVHPSAASYTVRDNAGAIVNSLEDETITLGATDTGANITLNGTTNTGTLPNELRYIEVSFVYAAATYSAVDFYMLRANMRFPLKPDEVKAAVGLGSQEYPDDQIDIFNAFFLVQSEVTDVNLTTVLETGSANLPHLINAVKYKAALLLVPALQSATMQMEQADNTLYKRFMEIDFDSIAAGLAGLYSQAVNSLRGLQEPAIPVLSLLAQGTDPLTGE